MLNLLGFDQSPRRIFCGTKRFRVKMMIFTYFGSNVNIAKSLISEAGAESQSNRSIIKLWRTPSPSSPIPPYLKMLPKCHSYPKYHLSMAVTVSFFLVLFRFLFKFYLLFNFLKEQNKIKKVNEEINKNELEAHCHHTVGGLSWNI